MSRPQRDPPPDPAAALAEGLDAAMIREVVARFYADARQDPVIGPVFRAHVPDARWQAHLERIEAFWCAALLGHKDYDGRPMQRHLGIPELEDRHFARWLTLFRRTVNTVCPPASARLMTDRAERIAASFRINIAMHRGQDLVFQRPLPPDDPEDAGTPQGGGGA